MKKFARILVCASLCVSALALCACGADHQVISTADQCASCHSESKATYDVSSPKGAYVSNDGVIEVTVSGNNGFSVSHVIFTKEDGSHFVPYSPVRYNAAAGEAKQITLEPGIWAINAGADETPVSCIVVVDSSASSDFDGKISLKG